MCKCISQTPLLLMSMAHTRTKATRAKHACSRVLVGDSWAGAAVLRPAGFSTADASMAAAVVEGHQYAYVYKAVAQKQPYGSNLIVQLGLAPDSLGVLGRTSLMSMGGGGSRLMLLSEDAITTISV